jgi:hypothetical protein
VPSACASNDSLRPRVAARGDAGAGWLAFDLARRHATAVQTAIRRRAGVAVAAGGVVWLLHALARAAIVAGGAVVALLVRIEPAVAADFEGAVRATAVPEDGVRVVAGLARVEEAVAAGPTAAARAGESHRREAVGRVAVAQAAGRGDVPGGIGDHVKRRVVLMSGAVERVLPDEVAGRAAQFEDGEVAARARVAQAACNEDVAGGVERDVAGVLRSGSRALSPAATARARALPRSFHDREVVLVARWRARR